MGPQTADERQAVIKASTIYGHYEQAIDRESAYEKLRAATQPTQQGAGVQKPTPTSEPEASGGGWLGGLADLFGGASSSGRSRGGDSIATTAAKSAARAIGSQVGQQLIRGVLGSLLGGGSRRR